MCRGDLKVYDVVPTYYGDKVIGEFFGVYARLLGHLEAFLSIICKKRFHLNYSNLDKAMLNHNAIENL